ncbi:EspA/EspE family type VII secretion system effector [Mycobacterium parmense]|uniref:Uncharacterized protein n=1 Tax=Mycobacterium parmense TaxID=185642 RepID=A0A7I7YZH4_9MYCO|nr:EspA/EspE family type VII secretion system effector [Mycobacterium parmense]MCV7352754.1 hypothetical protein [Mycobacterium parmense]ORW54663.1 hypothetical protein AWC20_19415 [Mycobacterium parmense]BBZ46762.1 hypothetical protein MPRM_40430 [Mycobacterium parmense]
MVNWPALFKTVSDAKSVVGMAGGLGKNVYAKDWEAVGVGSFSTAASLTRMGVKKWADQGIKNFKPDDFVWNSARDTLSQKERNAAGLKSIQDKYEKWTRGAEIIEWAIFIITLEEFTFGPGGSPVKGDKFGPTGAAYPLGQALDKVGSALPDGRWQGSAADAYAARNKTQQERIRKLMDDDVTTKKLIDDTAAKNKYYRQQIAITKDGLGGCIFVAVALYAWKPAASYIFQLSVSAAALAGVNYMVGDMATYSRDHTAAGAQAVIQRYKDMAAAILADLEALGAKVPDGLSLALQTAPPSGAPSFEDILKMGMASQTAAESSHQGPLAAVSSRSARGDGTARYGGDDLYDGPAEPTEQESPETAAPQAPAGPGWAMPTLSQVAAVSARGATMSGQMSQHMNLVNQTMGSVQQLATIGQQGAAAAPPAERAADAGPAETAPAEPVSADAADGAAPGAEPAERAPVDLDAATAGADQGTNPDPARRAL